MKCYVIAQVINNCNTLVGYKLLDADSGETMVVNIDSMKQVLRKQPDFIKNVALINNTLTGTNGKLDRYAKVDVQGNLLNGEKSPLVVLNRLGDVGYTVVDFKGQIVKMPTAKVVEYAKNQGIANGKVVEQDNVEFISSISESYETINIAPSKAGANVRVNIPIRMGTDTASIAKHTAEDIQTEMEYNDVFQSMTPEQRNVLKQYYTWYTVDAYKKLAKNVRLNLAPGKAEKLAQLRGIDKWQFAGINDSYMEGNFKAHCELGHRLRYEYFAIPEDALDEMGEIRTRDKVTGMRARRDTVQDLRDAGAIVFGETCAGDFFNIAPEDMKKLVKTRKTMSDEIELMSNILTNHLEFNYTKKYALLTQIITKLGNSENVVKVFGDKVGFTMLAFMKSKMPFPMSLVILAGEQARNNIEAFWSKVLPNRASVIHKIMTSNEKSATGLQAGKSLLWFISEYTIEGDYQYNPVEDQEGLRKDVGRYNKETREERSAQLSSLMIGTSVNVRFASLDDIESYLYNVEQALKVKDAVVKIFNDNLTFETNTLGAFQTALENMTEAKRYKDIEFTEDKMKDLAYLESTLAFDSSVQNDFTLAREFCKHYYTFRGRVFRKPTIYSYRARVEAWKNTAEINEYSKDIEQKFNGDMVKYVSSVLDFLIKQAEIDKTKDRFFRFSKVNSYTEQDEIDRYLVAKMDYITYGEYRKADRDNNTTYGINYNDIDGKCSLVYIDNIMNLREISEIDYNSDIEYIKSNREAEKRRQEVERNRKQREQEELERLAEQQRLEQEAAAKKEMEEEAKLDRLKEMLDKCPADLDKSYGVQTTRAILSSGLRYSKMSPKQKWRIDKTIKELEALNNSTTQSEDVDYDLDSVVVGAPQISNKTTKVEESKGKLEQIIESQAANHSEEAKTTSEEAKENEPKKGSMFGLFSNIPAEEPTVSKETETTEPVKEQGNTETQTVAEIEKTDLDKDADLKAMVDKLLAEVNFKTEKNNIIRFAAQVALTVSKRGNCSEKQRKYMEKGFAELNK